MVGRTRSICGNAKKYRKRQNILLIIIFLIWFCLHMLECLGRLDDIHGFPQFVFILFVLYSLVVVWNRYRKIEIVGICGIAKWFGIHKFYVADLEKRYGKIGYYYAERENYSIYSMKYQRYIFHTTENDEGHESISGCITNPPKGYCQEQLVERKYRIWCGIPVLNKKYEAYKLHKYGNVLDDAEIIGGMDLLFGTVIPIYEFKDKQGKCMAWGVYRIKVRELEQKLHKKCQIYYAPGKTECVME